MTDRREQRTAQRVDAGEAMGSWEMRVMFAEPSPEAAERWSRRSEVLAQWLLTEWLRQQAERN